MSSSFTAPWMRAGLLAATVATAGCSGQDVPDAAATAPAPAVSPATPPAAPQPGSTPPPSPVAPSPIPSRPADFTQDAAARYVPPATASPAGPPPAAPAGVDYANPLAVAAGYVSTRLTYRFDDLPAYRAALTAPAFTTPAFAARSEPSSTALAQVQTAQETSAVRVGGPQLVEGEAPNSPTTQYVSVPCTTTTTYRGGGGAAPATWTLRLLQAPPGQWRVDGVLSTS